jgi:hypothetical protein
MTFGNVPITPGSGRNVAIDTVGGVEIQRIKLVSGAEDSSTGIPGDTNRGLKANIQTVARVSVTPTISAAAIYASGDAVGGLLTFANAARFTGGGVWLRQVVVLDKDQERAPLELALFDRIFTPTGDNNLFDPSDADLANLLTVVPISEYFNYSTSCAGVSAVIDIPLLLNGTSLFGQLITRGTPTYTATTDIIVTALLVQE